MVLHALALATSLCLPACQESAPPAPPAAATPVAVGDAAARALWEAITSAAVAKDTRRATAFVLDFEATRYSGENQTNDASATYSYMEPGYVRMVLKSGRERLRGPDGDWLIDKSGATRLVGRDFKQDIGELEESVAVARTFAHLSDPRGLSMEALRTLPAPPAVLPPKLRELAGGLDWLRLESRDFRAPPRPGQGPAPLDVLELGVERATRTPRIAVLTDPEHPEGALALSLEGTVGVDGYRVPERVTAWRLDLSSVPLRFPDRQTLDLWFTKGTLAPKLTPDDFRPRR